MSPALDWIDKLKKAKDLTFMMNQAKPGQAWFHIIFLQLPKLQKTMRNMPTPRPKICAMFLTQINFIKPSIFFLSYN